ncbi:unnamed protein product [Rotaria sp. Silwood1]|nr:unnamed protein product [Rotaria sp. Silwood1]CAF0916402.1 unnamed protein product [Rotaria sp. Silwood1]CAF0942851.1 unnamed protein product [Rotaria sp. Silwood1]CAF3374696.1 unnamed protein product [Rotaria sp. Silwood1]CAF3394660.1 unnamed protein product [Rotaria sp. Silwood1]
MWCDPPSIISADIIQPTKTNWTMSFSSAINDKQQLSFIYQPGVGLYDKKIDLDQDLRINDVDERIQSFELSPSSSTFTSDVDHRWSSSSSSSIESSSPNRKPNNLYKSYLRRQNEQDSLPIREKLFSSDDILSDKTTNNSSSINTNYQIKCIDVNITTNLSQENSQKRKFDQNLYSNKKLRHSSSSIIKDHLQSNEKTQCEILSKTLLSSNSDTSIDENFKCEKNLLDEELDRQKAKLKTIDDKRPKQQLSSNKLRSNSNERLQKKSITTIIKNIPMVKKLSSENQKSEIISSEKEVLSIPSQGLLLCPKEEPIKKKKKKKIASTIISNTELLDDDSVLDSILFNEMQSVQQQWQQFLILTMEKELHINPSDGKKKSKLNKFNRTNEFLLSYDSLYDFEGMKHWCPTSR